MKKAFSVLLALSMLLSLVPAGAQFTDVEDSSYGDEINELYALGIITGFNDGTVKPKANLTRAEYAQILMNMVNIDVQGSALPANFTDLTAEHWAYDEIMFLVASGYFAGYEDDSFRPNNNLTGTEAIKVLIHVLGYQYRAMAVGYPEGYHATASSIGLIKGLKLTYSNFITREQVFKLISNALVIPLMEQVTVGDNPQYAQSGATILSQYLKAGKGKGVVTANDTIALSGDTAKFGNITINGSEFKCLKESDRNLVGMSVTYWYKLQNDGGSYELIHLVENSDNRQITINRMDYRGINGSKLLYEDENERELSVNIIPSIRFFVNGVEAIFDRNLFENAQSGELRLVSSSGGSSYDAAFATIYETITVDRIERSHNIIYDMDNPGKSLNLGNSTKTIVLTRDGKNIKFADISRLDVVSYFETNERIEAYVTRKSVNGVIETAHSGTNPAYTINGQTYDISRAFTHRFDGEHVGKSVDAYFDIYGNIAFFAFGAATGKTIVYLIKVADVSDGVEPSVWCRYYSPNEGLINARFAPNARLNGDVYKNLTAQIFTDEFERGGEIPQVVAITRNADGDVDTMEQPKSLEYLKENNLNGFCEVFPFATREYRHDGRTFGHRISIALNSTPIIFVPSDVDTASDKDYKVLSSASLTRNGSYEVGAYNMSTDYAICSFIVVRESNVSDVVGGSDPMYVVKRTTNTINEDGAMVTRVYTQKGSTDTYFEYMDAGEIDPYVCTRTPCANGGADQHTIDELEPGDVIRYKADGNRQLLVFQFLLDMSEKTWHGPHRSYTSGYEPGRDTYIEPTTVTGQIDNYLSCEFPYQNSNGTDEVITGDYEYITFSLTEAGVRDNITIVDATAGSFTTRNGTVADIEIGDDVIIHFSYNQAYGVIVYKYNMW